MFGLHRCEIRVVSDRRHAGQKALERAAAHFLGQALTTYLAMLRLSRPAALRGPPPHRLDDVVLEIADNQLTHWIAPG